MDVCKMLFFLFIVGLGGGATSASSTELNHITASELLRVLLTSKTLGEDKDLLVIAPPKLVSYTR